ncbi:MAG: hypothetical protein FWG44_08770 [Oscillospiraceae bacterium]|nr:hypothetical protein [Oscillospiraceae bacterium]
MKIMINLVLTALIPTAAYIIAAHLGVKKKRNRLLAALIGVSYPAVIACSALTTDEPFGFLFPLIISLIMLYSANLKTDNKNAVLRNLLSVLLGVMLVAGVVVYERLFAVAAAAMLTILFARVFYKKKIISVLMFLISSIVSGAAVSILNGSFLTIPWNIGLDIQPPDVAHLFNLICGHLFYFSVSTWGLGILGLCLFIKRIRNAGNISFVLMFAFLSLLLNVITSVISRQGVDLYQAQETLIYGKHMDSIIPLILISVVCCILTQESEQNQETEPQLELRLLLTSVILLGVIFTAFFAFPAEVIINAVRIDVSAVPGLYPLRIGTHIDSVITIDTLFLSVSAVLSIMALFIVFISCAGRYRFKVISGTIAAIALYSLIYTSAVYLPYIMSTGYGI